MNPAPQEGKQKDKSEDVILHARFMIRNSALSRLLAMVPLFFVGSGAGAADQMSAVVSKDKPVMLTASQVTYDEHAATAIAIGNVQVVQGDTILLADKVTYDQNTDMVHAVGNVSVLEPTGDVLFSDDAELKNNMQKGVVNQFRARLKDNSLFAAREGRRINKQVTKLKDMVFSPCKVCQATTAASAAMPLWQIAASKATIDENQQRVTYQNATMDFYGIPIMYTPYFSHPTPDAPNQSGLLQPEYLHDSILGSIIKEPVYYTFAPNYDLTLTPWYMTAEHPLLEGEFRGLTKDSTFSIRGAIIDARNRDDNGDEIPGDWVRGYIEAHAKVQLDKYWDAGLDAEHVSDDTFLQFYHFGFQDMLTSRLYAERLQDRNYFDIESLAFQGLQPEDQLSVSPYILPQANLHLESEPLAWHSRLMLDANALELTREVGDTDQRISSTASWKLPYVTHNGQVYELTTSLRADGYNVNNQLVGYASANNEGPLYYNGDTGRFIPQADFNWRYPFVNRFGEGKSLMIAPIVEVTESPDLRVRREIPNEDSQVAELSDINLFSPDRFSGLDEVESGLRGAYGTRGQLQWANQEYIEWLFGQAYQQYDLSPFPLTTATQANYSDYIGRLALKYYAFDLAYAFRLDRQTFSPTSNEVNIRYAQKPVNFDITYLTLQNEPLFGDRKEVFGNASFDLAPNWTLNLGGRRDLGSSEEVPSNASQPISELNPLEPSAGTVGINTGLVFHNECIQVATVLNRSYISEQDVKPSTTFGVTVVLKNFGAPGGQASAANATPAGNDITSTHSADNPVNPALTPTAATTLSESMNSGTASDTGNANGSTH